uniref:RING-type E3 ubiquitin transferase n=1 Tax=Chinchilla lanigera TaxID=34839 RepID=A0A8C2USS5_CHILA
MLHEARDRQKYFNDVQYLRDMQHKEDFEYQACLRRQEYRRDLNEKKRDQFGVQETSSERSLLLSNVSPKQSSGEEEYEPRPSARKSGAKCDSKLPAIDQPPVKQKHKSTMTPRKPAQVGPSKPCPEAPKILSWKGRPNLGRLTVGPETHSSRASEDRSRQRWQPPAKAPTLWGSGPVVQQETLMWAGKTKLNRTTQERRSFTSSSQLVRTAENPPEGTKQGAPNAPSLKAPHSALTQTFQGMKSPQVLSGSAGPTLAPSTMAGPRRTACRFQGEERHPTLSLNTTGENDDAEKETDTEEGILLGGVQSPHSPSSYKQSRFLGPSASQGKNKNFEDNADHCRGNSFRSQPNHGSSRISNTTEPVTKQSSVRQRMFQEPRLPAEEPVEGNDGRDSKNEKKTSDSCNTKSDSSPDNDLNAKNASNHCISTDDGPGTHDYERDCQGCLTGSRNSPNSLTSDRPTASRPSVNPSASAVGPSVHTALRDHVPTHLSTSSTLGPTLDPRFSVCQPLPAIRSGNPFGNTENHDDFPVNGAHESDVRATEDINPPSQPQGAPLHADLSVSPQGSWSSVDSPGSSLPGGNLQGHWRVLGSLQENGPFTFFVVSESPNQNDNMNSMSASGLTNEKGATEKKADPEKLKKLQESLLEEDSEEEGDLCRICQIAGGSPTNALLEPCSCVGSLRFVHHKCLEKWLQVKITSGADLNAVKTCEMCKQDLLVDLDDFNITEFYQKHRQSRAQNELMNSGLYLMLLLHLYEQRFAELMRLGYGRLSRERVSLPLTCSLENPRAVQLLRSSQTLGGRWD